MDDAAERFKGLDRQEKTACFIAESALGAVAEPWDVDGRQHAVDAMLTLPDGRRAAFEVMNLADKRSMETVSALSADNFKWPLPGKWWWSIEVGKPKHMRRLKQIYERIILLCEARNVTRPEQLAWEPEADPDLQWLVQSSSCNMLGHPELGPEKGAHVVPLSASGVVDDTLTGFAAALTEAFEADKTVERHFKKLENAQADERHFFVMLHTGVLPFSIIYVLMSGDQLPREFPEVPDHISHVWLAPNFSKRILLWSRADGWRNIYPYADEPEQ